MADDPVGRFDTGKTEAPKTFEFRDNLSKNKPSHPDLVFSPEVLAAAESLAERYRTKLQGDGVKVEDRFEYSTAAKLDKNPAEISNKELGAYLLAASMMGNIDVDIGKDSYKVNLTFDNNLDATDITAWNENRVVLSKIAQHVFGDNYKDISEIDTLNARANASLSFSLATTLPPERSK